MSKNNSKENPSKKYLAGLSLGAIGIVFGDLGTSVLYSLQTAFSETKGMAATPENILGILSLMFWALMLVISFKYLTFVLRADNDGEGGIIAMTALLLLRRDEKKSKLRGPLIIVGLLGASLWFGESLVTPPVSILSAVEGLKVASIDPSQTIVIAITIVILLSLFFVQRFGSGGLGKIFGPIMIIWFITIGLLGIYQIFGSPEIFKALNPVYAIEFFARNGAAGFFILGAVFLVVTGGEALYTDIGHFGVLPIRLVWFGLILPALLLNYFGQGALLLQHPEAIKNPFFLSAPGWALYPVVLIATVATIIASQAVISGAFSVARQAIHLGFIPRMKIEQTSAEEVGQVYIPMVNWIMMILCIALVVAFRTSVNLAHIYGMGVSFAMLCTGLFFGIVAYSRWNWSLVKVVPITGIFLIIDLAFLASNSLKIPNGGWFQVVVGIIVVTIMTTWKRGREVIAKRLKNNSVSLKKFLEDIGPHAEVEENEIKRVEGTAIYMYSNPRGTPQALLYNIKHNKVIHEKVIILSVQNTDHTPYVPLDERIEVEDFDEGFYRIIIRNGFKQGVSIPYLLKNVDDPEIDLQEATYFLGRERILPKGKKRSEMAKWRDHLFGYMLRNEQPATNYFGLPADKVIEIGAQLEM